MCWGLSGGIDIKKKLVCISCELKTLLQNLIFTTVEERLQNFLLNGSVLRLFLYVLELLSQLICPYLLTYASFCEIFILEPRLTLFENVFGAFSSPAKNNGA